MFLAMSVFYDVFVSITVCAYTEYGLILKEYSLALIAILVCGNSNATSFAFFIKLTIVIAIKPPYFKLILAFA